MSSQVSGAPTAAVFLSYSRDDSGSACAIADALRAVGVEVWFDQNELRGGDAWDASIKRRIRECALFVPVISANTQARLEGYFRLEWKLAEDRSHLMARGKPFLVPVAIDDTSEREAHVPEAFLAVQWVRVGANSGTTREMLATRVQALLAGSMEVGRVIPNAPGSEAPPRPGGALGITRPASIPDYELIRKIGEGGYGEVWLARGLTGAYRAVKIVWRNRFADAEPFEREFRGLKESMRGAVGASGSLALLHVGRDETAGFFYYVMELADDAERGRTIDPARYVPLTLKELRTRRGRLPVAECREVGLGLARELAALHARGLVHRDIKPSNVIFVNGAAKLADIGLVASVGDARTFVGTEGFVPPEGPGSPAADVFALGKVLYELATGSDRQAFPQLPETFTDAPEREAYFKFNDVLLRACDPRVERRYRDAAALVADLEALQAGRTVAGKRRSRVGVMVGLAVVLLIGGISWLRRPAAGLDPLRQDAAATSISVKSIAVLPFANLSPDPANAFFADGVHEDVLSKLISIPELRVVSRATVMGYRDSKKPVPEIGRELGVAYLLEGSVRREGAMVRVTGQLIDARTDRPVRALTLTKSVTDVFSIQSELAQAIAAELQAVIDPGTKGRLDRRPTESAAAYEAYLRGRVVMAGGGRRPTNEAAEKAFQSAVDADPNFAEAWAELAVVHSVFLFQAYDTTPERKARADAAMAKAQQLAPDLPDVQRAQANFTYNRFRDYARAVAQLEELRAKWPNDAAIHHLLGAVQRRNHRWADSVASSQRAVELEPASYLYANTLGQSLSGLRRWDDIKRGVRRAPALWGGPVAAERWLLSVMARADASRTDLDAYIAKLTPGERALPENLAILRARARERGDLAEFRRLDQQQQAASDPSARDPVVEVAFGYAQLGDLAGARARLGDLPVKLRAQVAADAANAQLWLNLGLVEALLGNREEALRAGRKSCELMSEATDPYFGPQWSKEFAVILAWCGEKERGLAELRRLALMPAGYVAAGDLAHGARWTPLRGDPRFREIIDLVNRHTPLPLVNGAGAPSAAAGAVTTAPLPPVAETPGAAEKSLVVLPLENLGADPANIAFTDGMHAEIIVALGTSADLKVISRNSAIAVNDPRARLPEIASKLGVANVVTGSVRRAGEQFRIVIELRRARDEALLWTKIFEGKFDDVFAIQAGIADEVARVLQARERPDAEAAQFLTKNPRAYELLLQARHAASTEARTFANTERYIARLEEVMALDPNYFSAASTLAVAHANAFRFNLDAASRTHHAARAKHWADTAARLMPGGTGDRALMAYYMEVDFNFARAVAHAERALRSWPNDAGVMNGASYALAGVGRMTEALAMVRRSIALDPLNRVTRENQLDYLVRLRRVDEWRAAEAEYATVAGKFASEVTAAMRRFRLTGEMPADLTGWSAANRMPWLHRQRKFAEALPLVEAELAAAERSERSRFELLSAKVEIFRGLGRGPEADRAAAEMLALADEMNAAAMFDASMKDYHQAMALACLGRADEAMAAGRRWVSARSATTQLILRWDREAVLARLCARVGRPRECLELLGPLLRAPSGITVPALRADAAWDNVRADPGFQALLADPKNSAPL